MEMPGRKLRIFFPLSEPDLLSLGCPGNSAGKESACNVEDPGLIPGSGRSFEEGNGNPFQYSRLENPMDRGAWRVTSMGLKKVRQDWCDLAHPHTGNPVRWFREKTPTQLLPLPGSGLSEELQFLVPLETELRRVAQRACWKGHNRALALEQGGSPCWGLLLPFVSVFSACGHCHHFHWGTWRSWVQTNADAVI